MLGPVQARGNPAHRDVTPAMYLYASRSRADLTWLLLDPDRTLDTAP